MVIFSGSVYKSQLMAPCPHPLLWSEPHAPAELAELLECLESPGFLERAGERPPKLTFKKLNSPGSLSARQTDAGWEIGFSSASTAARAVGLALAGVEASENTSFRRMGVMLDCSRNAVMRVEYLQSWLKKLALLGFNQLMLYTEDTYSLPAEPFFGYMRGAYSAEEIRAIDDFAAKLGIEVVACFQTLGHCEQFLRWPAYQNIADTGKVMRVDQPGTYALIEKMIAFWSNNLRSRRVHLGMDEAHDLGRGKWLDANPWRPRFDLLTEHLERVANQCTKAGLKPMIWSDMFFRIASRTNNYYDREAVVPPEVRARVPQDVDLVYWDYYHNNEDDYRHHIQRHLEFGHKPIMASGVWTWSRFWYDEKRTRATVLPCTRACHAEGVEEIFFTLWGDGGSYCEFDSAFAGLTLAADACFGGAGEPARMDAQLQCLGLGGFKDMCLGSDLHLELPDDTPAVQAGTVLWDDPLLGVGWQGRLADGDNFWLDVIARLEKIRDRVEPLRQQPAPPDYNYLWSVVHVMVLKLHFRKSLTAAYRDKDAKTLRALAEKEAPRVVQALRNLQTAFRRQWLRRNKAPGMETVQIRIGTGITRYEETARRILEFLDGRVSCIEELEIAPSTVPRNVVNSYARLSTGSYII